MVSTHAVVAGETLSALALRFYGDAELYRLIAAASGIADPDVVNVGQRLIMPDFTRYTVVAGDTLSALAARFYGDASLYPLIAAVNGIADPGVIDVGQVLVIFIGRSDGFGLRIVDRNENDPRLWYYRFQTSAIGWNPGVNVLLPDDYRTSGRTYPVLYLFHGGGTDQDFRTFDFLGIRDLTAGKPIIIVMPDAGTRAGIPTRSARSSAHGTGRHSTSPSCSPGSRRTSEPTPNTTAARSPGFRWVASAR